MKQPPFASRIYYGWVVVGVTFIAMIAASGVRSAPSVFIYPWEQEFGWDRASVSLAISVGLLLFGLSGPFAGQLFDRFGPRTVMVAGMLLIAGSSLPSVMMTELWQLNLLWGLLSGVGTGTIAGVLGITVANRWFIARRGLVIGITGASISVGQLVFLPYLMSLVVSSGWRSAATVLGLVVIALVPLIVLLMRDDPADVGLPPYGGTAVGRSTESAAPLGAITMRVVRSRNFWLLAGQFVACGVTSMGLVNTHLIPHAIERGIPAISAASALALMGAMNLVGTIVSGWLTDRVDPRKLLACIYVLRGSALFALPFVSDFTALAAFAIVYGLDVIATVPPTAALAGRFFGSRNAGTVFGWVLFTHQIGAAVAAYAAGWMRVYLGDYQLAFLLGGLTALAGAAVSLSIGRPKPPPALAVTS